jgi:hypothetical protein
VGEMLRSRRFPAEPCMWRLSSRSSGDKLSAYKPIRKLAILAEDGINLSGVLWLREVGEMRDVGDEGFELRKTGRGVEKFVTEAPTGKPILTRASMISFEDCASGTVEWLSDCILFG